MGFPLAITLILPRETAGINAFSCLFSGLKPVDRLARFFYIVIVLRGRVKIPTGGDELFMILF
jgi:hypothetical protein